MKLGVIADSITVSGDGTCVHSHASPYGHKVCQCSKNGISNCRCDRHYSDPDASWGWDSDLNSYYFGHTLYMLSCHNENYQVDLPLHIRFLNARRHDSVSGIVTLTEFRHLHPQVTIQNLCFDSANDNYPTYELCKEWGIRPFIDLNNNTGFRMVNWGYDPNRHRRKWRCPLACGKVDNYPCKDTCSTSPYGRCIYTKPDWDIRLYTSIPRGTKEYKKIYNNRTGSDRVNHRILNHYHLHDMKIHGKKHYSFFAMIAGINIHLDARLKKQRMDTAT